MPKVNKTKARKRVHFQLGLQPTNRPPPAAYSHELPMAPNVLSDAEHELQDFRMINSFKRQAFDPDDPYDLFRSLEGVVEIALCRNSVAPSRISDWLMLVSCKCYLIAFLKSDAEEARQIRCLISSCAHHGDFRAMRNLSWLREDGLAPPHTVVMANLETGKLEQVPESETDAILRPILIKQLLAQVSPSSLLPAEPADVTPSPVPPLTL